MKIFTLFLAASVAATAAAAPAPRFTHHKAAGTAAAAPHHALRAAAANPIWVPQHQEVSSWLGEWVLESIYSTTYTNTGKIAAETITSAEDGSATRETNTYNENDMLATRLIEISSDGTEFTNSVKEQRTYDSRLTDVIVENQQWVWMSSWEQLGNNYKRIITRDADGNITGVTIATLYQGEYDPMQRLTVTYTDGKASAIVSEQLDYDESYNPVWVKSAELTDIVWEQTDGQIYDVDGLMSGANRIKSCHLVNSEDDVDLSVVYNDHGYVATRTGLVQGFEATAVVTYEITDANGSERLVETFTLEEDGETHTESYTDVVEYDAYGFEVLRMSTSEFMGETAVEELVEGVLTYDETHGYPLTYTTAIAEFDEDTEEIVMANEMHVVLSDYVDATTLSGIGSVTVGTDDTPAEYFRIDGTRADASALAPGLYIVRRGGNAQKVIIR